MAAQPPCDGHAEDVGGVSLGHSTASMRPRRSRADTISVVIRQVTLAFCLPPVWPATARTEACDAVGIPRHNKRRSRRRRNHPECRDDTRNGDCLEPLASREFRRGSSGDAIHNSTVLRMVSLEPPWNLRVRAPGSGAPGSGAPGSVRGSSGDAIHNSTVLRMVSLEPRYCVWCPWNLGPWNLEGVQLPEPWLTTVKRSRLVGFNLLDRKGSAFP